MGLVLIGTCWILEKSLFVLVLERSLESFVHQVIPRCNLLFLYFWKAFSLVSFYFLVFVIVLFGGTWGLVVMSEIGGSLNHGTFQGSWNNLEIDLGAFLESLLSNLIIK
jgi:hypothetical protein